MADEIAGDWSRTCTANRHRPYARSEVGGRRCRQPGQVRKEAATTISCRVVGFHLPFPVIARSGSDAAIQNKAGLLRYARNDAFRCLNEKQWTPNRPAWGW